MRSRSIGTVIDELMFHKDSLPNLKSVFFTDDTMFARSYDELCLFAKEYKDKINLPFVCYTSPNTCQEDKLKALLEGGLNRLQMGIQTGSERINRDIYARNIPNDSVIRSAGIINKYREQMAPPDYHIIFCNPYEAEKDIIETITLLARLPSPFILTAFQLAMFPASELCKRAQRDGLLNDDTLFNFCNYAKALAFNSKQRYLNFILYLMNGKATWLKIGSVPRFMVNFLINQRVINYLKKHKLQLSFLMGLARLLSMIGDFVSGKIILFKQKCKNFIIK
jgi:coproporphyrinogen III oxidase-like Fe-S oxidoreductase